MSNSTPSKDTQSSKNALTHGVYAANVVLSWENQQEFDDLLRRYWDEYCPDGVSEETAVFDLASLDWKKRRLEAGLQQALQKQRDFGAAADAGDLIADDMARAAAQLHTAAAQRISENVRKRVEYVSKPDEAKADSEVVEFEKFNVLAKEFRLVSEDLVSFLHLVEKRKLDQIDRTFGPDIMERELKILAEIDRRIEKVLKRLVWAKEYKRLYGAKSVNANQIEATKLPAKSSNQSNGA